MSFRYLRGISHSEDYGGYIPCQMCGLMADPDDGVGGADPCLGIIEGVKYACCGHGGRSGYMVWSVGDGWEIVRRVDPLHGPLRSEVAEDA